MSSRYFFLCLHGVPVGVVCARFLLFALPCLVSLPGCLLSFCLPGGVWVVDPHRGAEGVVGMVDILFHRASLFLFPTGYWAPDHPIRRCDGGGSSSGGMGLGNGLADGSTTNYVTSLFFGWWRSLGEASLVTVLVSTLSLFFIYRSLWSMTARRYVGQCCWCLMFCTPPRISPSGAHLV